MTPPRPYDYSPDARDRDATKLGRALVRFIPDRFAHLRKLVVTAFGATPPLVVYLTTGDPSVAEAGGAIVGYALLLAGIYDTPNDEA